MIVIICAKYKKNRSRTVDAIERTRFSKSRPNDLEDIGQVNTLGSRFGFCVVSERIQASHCVVDRPLAVLTGLAKPDPVTRSGKNKHGARYLSQTHYKLLNLGALEVSWVNKVLDLKMSWHTLPTKLIKFAMSVRSRKHAPIIRHCWAVRMMICLIKSNTDKQQYPLSLLTNISNFRARKYHINIESQVPIRAFRLARVNYCAAGWRWTG